MLQLYLDTNVWGRPFDEQTQDRIQKETNAFFKILEGVQYLQIYKIIGSLILDDEIEQIEGSMKKEAVKTLVDLFIIQKIDTFSISLQSELKEIGLKEKDALHIAFAIDNVDYFITCDDEILSKSQEIERRFEIKVLNPVKFVREVK